MFILWQKQASILCGALAWHKKYIYLEMKDSDFDTHIDEVPHKPTQEVISTGVLLIQPLLTKKVLFFWTLHLLSSVPNRNEKQIR